MSTISNLDTESARFDPERTFETPEALLAEAGLTRGQKIAALERWRFNVEQRLAATSEGMAPEGRHAKDLQLLDKIGTVERSLEQAD
jgi:hypothetical protein